MRLRKDWHLSHIIEPSSLGYGSIESGSDRGFLGVSNSAWGRVGVITVLFAAVFWPNLRRLWLKTNPFTGEPNWSHSVIVPIVGLYFLYVHREELLNANARPFIWGKILRPGRLVASVSMMVTAGALILICHGRTGVSFSLIYAFASALGALGAFVLVMDWSLATLLFGIGVFVYGIYPGQNDYVKDIGMVVTLFGLVLLLTGWDVMRIAWFPIVFLVCAIPWPGLVYSWVAEPLQNMAARVAVGSLNVCGVDSMCNGTKIVIYNSMMQPPRVLNVAEACAGMRSLMTFISIGGAIAFLSNRPLWQKLIIVFSAVPIAIFCNVMRISGQGLLDHYGSTQWSESFAHQFVGMVMLLPAFFLIMFVGYLLDKIFIEEADHVIPGNDVRSPVASAISPKNLKPFTSATEAAVNAAPGRPTAIPPRPSNSVNAPPIAGPVSPRPSGLPPQTPRAAQRPPAYKPVIPNKKELP